MAAVHRLQQTLSHLQPAQATQQLSVVYGPTEPELLDVTLGELLTLQSLQYGDYECLVFPWTGTRWTYADLNDEADRVARGMLAMGIKKGDRVGIMAGNCEQYISIFFAAARVGAILVVLNNTYTPSELYYALDHTGMHTKLEISTEDLANSDKLNYWHRCPIAFPDPPHPPSLPRRSSRQARLSP